MQSTKCEIETQSVMVVWQAVNLIEIRRIYFAVRILDRTIPYKRSSRTDLKHLHIHRQGAEFSVQ